MQHTKLTALTPFGVMVEPLKKDTNISEVNTQELKKLFKEEQLILLRGFTTFQDGEEFSRYCENWGTISIWPFGKVLELVEQDEPEDHIFHHSYVPMHWDGMYRPQVPEYQIFHCVKAPPQSLGGRTTFSNTILVLKNASVELRDLWSRVTGIYQRQMEFYKSKTISPIIAKHPHRNFSVIRYNEPPAVEEGEFLNPPLLEFTGLSSDEISFFHQSMKKALYAPTNFYAHEWQDGDVIFADNFTLLHGREKFQSKTPRHLQRVQVLSNPPFNNPNLESYHE